MNSRLIGFVKGLYWMVTPWWLRERVQSRRIRNGQSESLARLAPWIERERTRVEARERGEISPPSVQIDWFDDASVRDAVAPLTAELFWPATQPGEVAECWSAARYLITLWR